MSRKCLCVVFSLALLCGALSSSAGDVDGTSVAYGYGPDANLALAAYPDDTLRFGYDGDGLLTSAATGLVNFRMRWYDPVTGRWLSKDPIGLSGGLNLYAFCNGNPVNRIDPRGLLVVRSGGIGPS